MLFSQPLISQIPVGDILVNHLPIDLFVHPHVNGLFVGKIHVGQPLVMVVPPWHVIATKLHELPTRPPIDRVEVLPDVVVVWNKEGVFQIGGFGMILLIVEDITRFKTSTFDVGQSSSGGFRADRC